MTEDRFEERLAARHMEAPSQDLAARIQAAAMRTPQAQASYTTRRIFPAIGYAFASVLVVATVWLWMPPAGEKTPQLVQQEVSDAQLLSEVFYYPEESLLF